MFSIHRISCNFNVWRQRYTFGFRAKFKVKPDLIHVLLIVESIAKSSVFFCGCREPVGWSCINYELINRQEIRMLTNDKSSHLHWVITILIMKFFETDSEAFSRNLLTNKGDKTHI